MYRYEQANWPRRVMRQSGAVPPITWFYARALQHIDAVVYRLSRGRALLLDKLKSAGRPAGGFDAMRCFA